MEGRGTRRRHRKLVRRRGTGGQSLPLDTLLDIVSRIVATVPVPVTVDFEGGYAVEPAMVAENVRRLLACGAVGINFGDQIVGGDGIYDVPNQMDRIRAIREMASADGVPLFINARTDLFLKQKDTDRHGDLLPDAKERAIAYAEAGASGFFVPGLVDSALIKEISDASPIPVNVMKSGTCPDITDLRQLGVSRVSYGPYPYFSAMQDLASRYQATQEA